MDLPESCRGRRLAESRRLSRARAVQPDTVSRCGCGLQLGLGLRPTLFQHIAMPRLCHAVLSRMSCRSGHADKADLRARTTPSQNNIVCLALRPRSCPRAPYSCQTLARAGMPSGLARRLVCAPVLHGQHNLGSLPEPAFEPLLRSQAAACSLKGSKTRRGICKDLTVPDPGSRSLGSQPSKAAASTQGPPSTGLAPDSPPPPVQPGESPERAPSPQGRGAAWPRHSGHRAQKRWPSASPARIAPISEAGFDPVRNVAERRTEDKRARIAPERAPKSRQGDSSARAAGARAVGLRGACTRPDFARGQQAQCFAPSLPPSQQERCPNSLFALLPRAG